jgi:GTP-binding protein YchF
MQIGLVGFPQAGKKTLFRLLTGADPSKAQTAIAPVRDPRVAKLTEVYHPAKVTPAVIQYVLLPDLTKNSEDNQEFFKGLALVDAIGIVVRAFEDETIFHIDGSVDPTRDLQAIQSEFLLNDLLFVEKRIERLQKESARKASEAQKRELELMSRCKEHLDQEKPLSIMKWSDEDQKKVSGYSFLTRKALLVILNAGENGISDESFFHPIKQRYSHAGVVQVSAKIEEELSALDDPKEKEAFLTELGIKESALDQLTRVSYQTLGLISYFTVGEDEVRAWTVKIHSTAPQAAGAIHSDLERTFIRAEQMSYQEFVTLGSEEAVRRAGKYHLRGKEYIVQDGDILNFRCGG